MTGTPAARASSATADECVTTIQALANACPMDGWRRMRPIGLCRMTIGRRVTARSWPCSRFTYCCWLMPAQRA